MLQWTEEELQAMREADAEIEAQGDLFPGISRQTESLCNGDKRKRARNIAREKAYYQENRERLLAYRREHYQKNRERILEQQKIRWKTDPTYRADNARRAKEYYRRKKKGV